MSRGFLSDERVQRSSLVDIAAEIKRETDKAWLVSDGEREVWLPKSQAEFDGTATFTMPEWLALEKGLI